MYDSFINDETGAVTVDWVVLTAALVGLGLAVMAVVSGGVEDISTDVGQTLTDTSVEFTFFGSDDAGNAYSLFQSSEAIFYSQSQADGFIDGFANPNNSYSDENFQDVYNTSQEYFASTGSAEAVDQLGILEAAADQRGQTLDMGESGISYRDALAQYNAANPT